MAKALVTFATAVAALLSLPLLAVAGAAIPSPAALAEIPPAFLALYQAAAEQRCPGLPWSVLAAIGRVESNHGRLGGADLTSDGTVTPPIIGPALNGSDGTAQVLDTDGGRLDGDPAFDRAIGPMQFLPSTWAKHGIDASGDGQADAHKAADAIHSAAGYLCTNGGGDPDRLTEAILAYNRSSEYLQRVLAVASRYAATGDSIIVPSDTLIVMLLSNPRLTIYEAGRRDIAEGRIDARVLLFLQLASEHWTLAVSSLQSGHSRCVGGRTYEGCDISNHWYGRAVDIYLVNARPVTSASAAAKALVLWAVKIDGVLQPYEIGHPWPRLAEIRRSFSDTDHEDHVHVGWS